MVPKMILTRVGAWSLIAQTRGGGEERAGVDRKPLMSVQYFRQESKGEGSSMLAKDKLAQGCGLTESPCVQEREEGVEGGYGNKTDREKKARTNKHGKQGRRERRSVKMRERHGH